MTIKSKHNAHTLKKLEAISGKKLTLGNFLWAIRQGEGFSQMEFADKLGVSKQYLCDLERGRRLISPKVAVAYAKKLGQDPRQILRLCLQAMVDRDGIHFLVDVKAA